MNSEMHFTVFTENKVTTPMSTSIDLQSKTVQSRINKLQQACWLSPWDFSSYGNVASQPEGWNCKLKSDENPKETIVSCCFISALLLYLYSISVLQESKMLIRLVTSSSVAGKMHTEQSPPSRLGGQ